MPTYMYVKIPRHYPYLSDLSDIFTLSFSDNFKSIRLFLATLSIICAIQVYIYVYIKLPDDCALPSWFASQFLTFLETLILIKLHGQVKKVFEILQHNMMMFWYKIYIKDSDI